MIKVIAIKPWGLRIAALTAAAVLMFLAARTVTLAVITPTASQEWGLSFTEPGTPPIPPISAADLLQYRGYYIGDTAKKTIYLTFDAGYEAGYSHGILDTLAQKGVTATFFLVGHMLSSQPELVRRMVADGHIVGNHTMTHPTGRKLDDATAFAGELTGFEDLFTSVVGAVPVKLYRPPGGALRQANLTHAREAEYATIFWSLAYADWDRDNQPDPAASLNLLMRRLHPGAVVLLHSTSATSAALLGDLIDAARAQGYTFGTLLELTAG